VVTYPLIVDQRTLTIAHTSQCGEKAEGSNSKPWSKLHAGGYELENLITM